MFHAIHELSVRVKTEKPVVLSGSPEVHMYLPVLPLALEFGWLEFRILDKALTAIIPEDVKLDHIHTGGHIEIHADAITVGGQAFVQSPQMNSAITNCSGI